MTEACSCDPQTRTLARFGSTTSAENEKAGADLTVEAPAFRMGPAAGL